MFYRHFRRTEVGQVGQLGNTKTTKGLQIQAQLDYRDYKKGVKVDNKDFEGIAITKNPFRGEWNYIIHPVVMVEIEA